MSPREWPYPQPSAGTTLILSTDLHHGRRPFTANQLDRAGAELDSMMRWADGHIIGGDLIHWGVPGSPEDAAYVAWENARKAANPTKPIVRVAGNHDVASFADPFPYRTIAQWRAVTGFAQHNTVTDIGALRVIGIAPDEWRFVHVGPMNLPPATLDWLDAQLAGSSRPCLVLTHPPIKEQYSGNVDDLTSARIASIIAARPSLVAWVSGHRHCNINTDMNHVKTLAYGGRNIAAINGPAAGGQITGSTNDPWDSQLHAMAITYSAGRVTTRWRNLLTRQWVRHNGELSKTLTISKFGS